MIVCIIPTLIGSLATSVKIDRDGVVLVEVIFGVGNGDNGVFLVLLLGMDEEVVVPLLEVTVGDLDNVDDGGKEHMK